MSIIRLCNRRPYVLTHGVYSATLSLHRSDIKERKTERRPRDNGPRASGEDNAARIAAISAISNNSRVKSLSTEALTPTDCLVGLCLAASVLLWLQLIFRSPLCRPTTQFYDTVVQPSKTAFNRVNVVAIMSLPIDQLILSSSSSLNTTTVTVSPA